ncbi:unnamed protein product, partial [Strongylus vulgaris]
MKWITKKFYTNFFARQPMSNLVIPTVEVPSWIPPVEVGAAIRTMKAATTPGPDHVSIDLLRAGGHCPHEILAKHL